MEAWVRVRGGSWVLFFDGGPLGPVGRVPLGAVCLRPIVALERMFDAMGSFLRRPGCSPGDPHGGVPTLDASFAEQLPGLHAFFTEVTYEDGSERLPGSLTMFADAGMLKACLSDKSTGMVAFVSGSSPAVVLERASVGLEAGSLDWRGGSQGGRKGGGRK